MSKAQYQKNLDIRGFIEKKDKAKEPYSVEDIEYINEYTGMGGMAKYGDVSRGLLYEYYTPDDVSQIMVSLCHKHGFDGGKILEPSCGIGRFLKYFKTTDQIDAYEYAKDNETSARITEISYPWVNLSKDYFESIFYQGNKRVQKSDIYDLVIGNPPYGKFSGFYAGKTREGKHFKGKTYDQYFIWAGIELVKPGGLVCMIVPSSFLSNSSSYTEFKKDLMEKSDLIEAFRLPRGVFEATEVETDILLFKKK